MADNPTIHRVFRLAEHWCVVADNGLAFYVGYVSIPDGHPWHELHYDTIAELSSVDVHGGLTYAGERTWAGWDGDGAPAGFYVGFDCGHFTDMPIEGSSMEKHWPGTGHRWTVDEVEVEVRRLAVQAQVAAVVHAVV